MRRDPSPENGLSESHKDSDGRIYRYERKRLGPDCTMTKTQN